MSDIMDNFSIDGSIFANVGLTQCTEIVEIRQRDDAGFSSVTGTRIQNIIGTFLNYNIVIDFKRYNPDVRNELFRILICPVEFHTFCLPHNDGINDGWRTFEGYIDGDISTDLQHMANENQWGSIALNIKAKSRYEVD